MSLFALGTYFNNFDVPGDGSCLVHSVCAAVDKNYKKLVYQKEKTQYVRELRSDLAMCIQENPDFQNYINVELPGFEVIYSCSGPKLYSLLAFELLSNRSLFYYFAPILAFYFSYKNCKIDIVLLQSDVLKGKRNGIPIYGKATHSYINGKAKGYIFILCTENHYSLLTDKDQGCRVFPAKSNTVEHLLQLLKRE